MERLSGHREKRRYPRVFVDLPSEFREMDASHLRGGVVVNASEGGVLIESVKQIPVGTKLHISVLFRKGFQLADFKLTAEIIWKEPLWKEDWEGYQYGLKIGQILKGDLEKLKLLLNGRFDLEEIEPFPEIKRDIKMSKEDTVKIRRYNVLVVDDEEGVRKMLVTLLSQRGHSCFQAFDGAEALAITMTNKFDAIITDLVMPKMDGMTLTKELLKRTPKLPIMVMTGHDNEFSSVTAIAAGAREFIKKPFSLTEFSTRFEKMMGDHELSVELEAKQNEMLFNVQRKSLEEANKLKKEIETLSGRLDSGYTRFRS